MAWITTSSTRAGEPTVNRLIGGDPARNGGGIAGSPSVGQPNGFPGDLFDLKNDMAVEIGWRCAGGGDGNVAGLYEMNGLNGGDVTGGAGTGIGGAFDVFLTPDGGTNTTIVGGVNQQFDAVRMTWFVLRTPADADTQRDLLFVLHAGSGTGDFSKWSIYHSYLGDWTGGSSQVPPSASDEVCIYGNPEATKDLGRPSAPSGSNNRSYWVLGDKAEEYSFAYWNARTGTTVDDVFGCFIMGQVIKVNQGTNPPATIDGDPHWFFFGGASGTGNSFDAFGVSTWQDSDIGPIDARWEDSGTTRERGVFANVMDNETDPGAPAGGFYSMAIMLQEEDDAQTMRTVGDDLAPFGRPAVMADGLVGKWAESPRMIKGWQRSESLFFARSTKAPAAPRVVTIDGARYVNWNGIILPWHATAPVIAG